MFSYTVYGLNIASYLPLPELTASVEEADVVIQAGSVPHPANPTRAEQCIWATETEAIFYWDDIGTFLVREGREIIVDAIPGANPDVLRLFLLGSALGTLLHQRGLLVLHGSVVSKAGSAVAFLGESGWGKSTMVAALCKQGYRLVADDVLAIGFDSSKHPIVFPGSPQVKLWADAVTSLGDDPATLPKIRPELEKYARRFEQGFSPDPQRLDRLYILGVGAAPEIESIAAQMAFKELIFHSYAVPFLGSAFSNPSHFQQAAHLINAIPIARLKRQRSLLALPEIVQLVEADGAGHAQRVAV